MYTLIDRTTGKPINVGDMVKTFRGEAVFVVALRPPHKPSSQGHVIVKPLGKPAAYQREFYAGVINGKYVVS